MSLSIHLRLIFRLLSSLTMFDYAYAWKKSFNDHNDVSYLMFDDDSLMYIVSIMTYGAYLHLDGHILSYNHELLCTRVDTALVITSGKTLFPMSALFGLQHEDAFNACMHFHIMHK